MSILGYCSTPTTCLWTIAPIFLLSKYPQYLTSRASGLFFYFFYFFGILCMSDQPACGHVTNAFATGCIGSNLDCPSACGICLHICLTVDGKGTDPRRTSPLNALALMSIILQHDSNAAIRTTARTEKLFELLLKAGQYFFNRAVTGEQWSPVQA